jgi:hypothetical protein
MRRPGRRSSYPINPPRCFSATLLAPSLQRRRHSRRSPFTHLQAPAPAWLPRSSSPFSPPADSSQTHAVPELVFAPGVVPGGTSFSSTKFLEPERQFWPTRTPSRARLDTVTDEDFFSTSTPSSPSRTSSPAHPR